MKSSCTIFFLIFLAVSILSAQDIPTPFIEQSFVKPGIRNTTPGKGLSITYFLHPRYRLQTETNDETVRAQLERRERLDVKLKIPLWNRERTKFLLGLYHSFEKYDFEMERSINTPFLDAIDGRRLKRSRMTAYYFRALNDKNYLAFRIGASYNGAYDKLINFDERYAVYRGAVILGIKRRVDRELALGVLVTKNFQRVLPLPVVIYNRTFNERWGLETAVPAQALIRRNFSETSMITMGYEYFSSAYSLDVYDRGLENPTDYVFKSSAIKFSTAYNQRLLTSWTWVRFEAGYALNFDSRFIEVGNIDNRVAAAPSNSFFISVSVFLSPPKPWVRDRAIENTIEKELEDLRDNDQ